MTGAPPNKLFAITFANECTRDSEYYHNPVAGQIKTLDNDFVALMGVNSGTYIYKYTVERHGVLSIFIMEYTQESLFHYYNNQNTAGSPTLQDKEAVDLLFDWGTGNVFSGIHDGLSFYLFFNILPPQSQTYF